MSITRIIFAVSTMILIYGGANFYVASRLYQWLNILFPSINANIFIGVYIFIALSMFLGFMPFSVIIKVILNGISAYWIGVFMYLLIFILLADITVLIGGLTNIIPRPISPNVIFYKGLIAIILTAGVVTYGMWNANQIKHVSYEIQLKNSTLNDMKIVMISDLHLGDINSETNLEKIVKMINELNPDIVCMVGDIFNDDFNLIRNPNRAIELFRSINAAYGVFAILGNHDGGRTLGQMIDFLEKSNITLLNDKHVIIDDRLALFGRLDANPIGGFGPLKRQNISDLIASAGSNMPVIVMEHNPAHIKEYGSEVDLILSGHTHKGQMFPGSLITGAIFVVDYGHYQKDGNSPHVIVTSGAGTWRPPMRVGTNNEIAGIVLR